MTPSELKPGGLYFVIGYEEEDLARPMVHSYEYIGTARDSTPDAPYHFRFLGSDDRLELAEHQLDILLTVRGLISALEEFALANDKKVR